MTMNEKMEISLIHLFLYLVGGYYTKYSARYFRIKVQCFMV